MEFSFWLHFVDADNCAGSSETMHQTTACACSGHFSGKPGKPENVREFGTCQGNVRDVVNSQGIVRGKILSWKIVPKLFITR